MIVGTSTLIYLEITSETSIDETSDTVKKIILNFLQIVSLASSLPLQWPQEISDMFDAFETVSSAGTTLLVPDCELSHLDTAQAFYYKQIFFTFVLPIIVILCVVVWSVLGCLCKKRMRHHKDYMVLSIVMLSFLLYPTLVKLTLSMLRCPKIGNQLYLMASLEEPCFVGEHLQHTMMLTIPQIILYVLGLPIAGTIHLLRNKDNLHKQQFYTRYGLLYLGYRDERAWWELVVAFRKVAVVSVGTFGTLLGVVDIQAHLALLIVFCSITAHLLGKPFDMTRANTRLLHNLELAALCICWLTFWGGLLFFLGHEKKGSVADDVKILMTVCLVLANVIFLIGSFVMFVKEYLSDRRKKLQRHSTSSGISQQQQQQLEQLQQLTQIVPINIVESTDTNDDGTETETETETELESDVRFVPAKGMRRSVTKSHASFIHDEFDKHEQGLQKRLKKQQEKAKRSTQLRLLARSQLKQSKALRKSTIFQELDDDEISLLIDQMTYKKRYKGDILCKQDDLSDNFYVIIAGEAVVTIHADDETEKVDGDGNGDDETPPVEVAVGNLSALQFFGESALLAASDEEIPHRTATVRVSSEKLELLCLHRSNYMKLMESADANNMFHSRRDNITSEGDGDGEDGGEMCSESASVLERLKSVADQRKSENKLIMKKLKTSVGVVPPPMPPPMPPPPIESDFSLARRGDQEMGSSSTVGLI
jgi:hypothetical protein